MVEYRLTRLTSLIDLANKLLDECNGLLKAVCQCQWLFVGEDFDKAGITTDRIEEAVYYLRQHFSGTSHPPDYQPTHRPVLLR